MIRFSEESRFNVLRLNDKDRTFGVLASGVAYNYFREAVAADAAPPSFLKVSTYPLPEKLIRDLVGHVGTILHIDGTMLRVTIGQPDENAAFLQALRKVLDGGT